MKFSYRHFLGLSFFLGAILFAAISRHYRELVGLSSQEAAWGFFLNISTELFGAGLVFFVLEVILRKRDERIAKEDAAADAVMAEFYKNPDVFIKRLQDEIEAEKILTVLGPRYKDKLLMEIARLKR